MADATLSQLKTRFNTRLRDTANTTFTSAEKDEMLAEAFNDPFVQVVTRDTTTIIVSQQTVYTIPAGITSILQLRIDTLGDGYGDPLDPASYDEVVIDGAPSIIFERAYKTLPAGKKLIFIGRQKLTTTDSIPDLLQDYILHLAMVTALTTLTTSFTTRFLKNDATMSDLLAAIGFHQREAARLRSTIQSQHLQVL